VTLAASPRGLPLVVPALLTSPHKRPILQIVVAELFENPVDEYFLRVVEAADSLFEVLEALEGLALSLV